jgi:transcriptional regulator
MFIPKGFEVEDVETLHDLMARHSFATLIGWLDGAPFATHLPLLVDRARGPRGTILGHIARANPHGRLLDGRSPALAVFQGPDAYVSPRWYPSEQKVPTWLYAVVHAYGTPRTIEDAAAVRALLERMVETYEAGAAEPWRLESQSANYLAAMTGAIVAFELPVDRIEGKFKLNQIKSEADRRGTIAGLRRTGEPRALAVADLMDALERRRPAP